MEHSKALACMYISLITLLIFLAGGAVFGLPAFFPVLYRRGVWVSVCTDTDVCRTEADIFGIYPDTWVDTKCCDAQMVRLSLVTSVAFFLSDAFTAPWGEAIERVGVRSMLALSVALGVIGAGALGLGLHSRTEWLMSMALSLLAIAGPGIFNAGYSGALRMLSADSGLRITHTDRQNLTALLAVLAAAAVDGSALTLRLVRFFSSADTGCILIASMVWALLIGLIGLCLGRALDATLLSLPQLSPPQAAAPLAGKSCGCIGSDPSRALGESSELLGAAQPAPSLRHALLQRKNVLLVASMAGLNAWCVAHPPQPLSPCST
jgi:hypothetical protein